MIYVIKENDALIFATHSMETFENFIDGLCVKYKIDEKRFDSKFKELSNYGIEYRTYIIINSEEE